MRDAGANPVAGDFLEPVAGRAPEIHGSQGMHPVTPGAVSDVKATQEAAEKADMAAFQPVVTSLAVTPATTTKAALATQQLVGTATPVDGVDVVVTASTAWVSSDPTKATVNAAGLVTAVATGESTVTGTYKGSTDTCVVTVS